MSYDQVTTDSDVYFELLRTILGDIKSLDPVREDTPVEQIHHNRLGPVLYQRDIKDVHQQLNETGFTNLSWCIHNAYAGQAMIVIARQSAIVMLGRTTHQSLCAIRVCGNPKRQREMADKFPCLRVRVPGTHLQLQS